MSENENKNETPIDPVTETGETMIPLSAVEPLLRWAQQAIVMDRADRLLLAAYDVAYNRLGVAGSHYMSSEGTEKSLARLPPLRWNRDYNRVRVEWPPAAAGSKTA